MKADQIHAQIIEAMKTATRDTKLSQRDKVIVNNNKATYVLWKTAIATYDRQTASIEMHPFEAWSGSQLSKRRIRNIAENL